MAKKNQWKPQLVDRNSPAVSATQATKEAIPQTPEERQALPVIGRALYVGVGGDLTVILEDDSEAVTFTAVPSGFLLPASVKLIATSSTADSILVLN